MRLLLTVDAAGGSRSVQVDVDPTSPTSELTEALNRELGADGRGYVVARTGQAFATATTVGALGLRHGDRLVSGDVPAGEAADADAGTVFELLVTSGSQAGVQVPLAVGEYVVGRDQTSDIMLRDDMVSRRHLHIGVGSKQVVVTDLGSSNGSFVDGRRVEGSVELALGQVLEIGGTQVTIDRPRDGEGAASITEAEGDLQFSRPPRVVSPAPDTTVRVPIPPVEPPRKKVPALAAIAPVLMGGVLYFVIGPEMLLFALMGPLMLFASMIEDRRSGRTKYRAAVEQFDQEMEQIEQRIADAHHTTVVHRRAAALSPAHVVRRVRSLASTIWERRPSDQDFLTLRIGVGDQPSRLQLTGISEEHLEELDNEHADRLATVRRAVAIDPGVPVDADLRGLGVLGVAGPTAEREGLLRWLVTQSATLASPRDLAIVALLAADAGDAWGWVRWLPHTTTLVAGAPGARTVACDPPDVLAVFQVVDDLVTQRRLIEQREGGFGGRQWHPHVLLVVPGHVPVPRPALSRVLTDGPRHGVTVIVGAPSPEQLPGECRAVARVGPGMSSTVTTAATGDAIGGFDLDHLTLDLARDTARRLAPLRDVSASSASSEVPRTVTLLDVLSMPTPSATDVLQRWDQHGHGRDLGAPVGVGPAGVFSLDLRRDGPHGLAAGTTGAGKSEFLQSMVGSLAATYPASRLTFVLVDYKGGAAFKDCVALPHTVGFFTDLDAHLAERALVSLNAELRRREHLLADHGAKDLVDLERLAPEAAPANLFIVFDEFAFLKKEVPQFVAGVIDIAQRGRSLGVHLMLATQRPSGVVDENIRANTNLRIALRMADDQDSTDVLDRADAAHIPKSLPGRAYVRIGHEVTMVQTAYGSATSLGGPRRQQTRVRPFPVLSGLVASTRGAGASGGDDAAVPSDLQRLVDVIGEAHRERGVPDQPHPWLDPLAPHYRLADLPTPDDVAGGTELVVTLGIVDLPEEQAQRPWTLDLGRAGHVLLYGTGGSGKTTALRTLAAGLVDHMDPTDLHLYALDFGGRGLTALAELPHCGGVVAGDDPERVDSLFAALAQTISERKRALAATGSASLAEHRSLGGECLPYVVVLVDNYGAFQSAYQTVDRGEHIDRFARIVADGRAVGIHVAITADRRSAVPTSVSASVSSRIVLRVADRDEYASLGLPGALAETELPPGRGFVDGNTEVQLAFVGDDHGGASQKGAITALAAELSERTAARAPGVATLADYVALDELDHPAPGRLEVPIGRSGTTHGTVWVDFNDFPVFGIIGPDRTGRSSALATLALGLTTSAPSLSSYLLAPRRTPASAAIQWTEVANGVEACETMARGLVELVRERSPTHNPDAPLVLVAIDDGDELADGMAADSIATILRKGRDAGVVVIAAVQTHVLHRTFGGWLTELRKGKHAVLLAPDVDLDGELLGVRLPRKASHRFPPGRGYLICRGTVDYVQIATTDDG